MTELEGVLWILQFASTAFMTGLICFCHLSVYSLFPLIEDHEQFRRYYSKYTANTFWTTAPIMGVEILCASALLWIMPTSVIHQMNFASAASLWLITFFIQMPQHGQLEKLAELDTKKALIRGNRSRVAIWCARSFFVGYVLYAQFSNPL